MSIRGVAVVARHEFRARLRTGRWRLLLGLWVAVIAGFTVLLRLALAAVDETEPYGLPMFGGLMLFVLGLVLLVAPAFAAQSVNGDRERGTLATLQVTLLTPADIALGKLAAAWLTALATLALTLPFVVWSVAEGGVGAARALVVLGVVVLLIGVVCAVAQALSALLTRGITSALLSYVVVFTLTVGTLIGFGLAAALVTETGEARYEVTNEDGSVGTETYQETQSRTDRVWWLLAPNPFVILADAAPARPVPTQEQLQGDELPPLDPLGELGGWIRELRQPPVWDYTSEESRPETDPRPTWPYGLGFHLVLGAASVWVTVRRLRTPARSLPRGVRVA